MATWSYANSKTKKLEGMLEALASGRARLKEYIWVLALLSKQALTNMILGRILWMRLGTKDGEIRGILPKSGQGKSKPSKVLYYSVQWACENMFHLAIDPTQIELEHSDDAD